MGAQGFRHPLRDLDLLRRYFLQQLLQERHPAIRVSQEDLDKLFDDAGRGSNATLTIDLPNQEIRGPDGGKVKFEIESFRKHCLINGLDDIGLTMEKKSSIDAYEAKAKAERAWA